MDGSASFGAWLKQRRKGLDLTQLELADRAGCSTALIRKIEADERRPSRQLAERLAGALGVRPADLALFLRAARSDEASEQLRAIPSETSAPSLVTRHGAHNLPAQVTSLIGRGEDVALALELLRGKRARLLTLVGPGGIGKTRLALEIATELVGAFADGVFFVALATIRKPELVPVAILRTLGLEEQHLHIPLDQIVDALWDKEMLLVLDNFEQVQAAAPQLQELLAACPGLKLMVTSRTVLRLRAEQQFPVEALPVPDGAARLSLAELAACPAVMLFVDRARVINPRFQLDEGNADAIKAICTYLEGIPLALELVTARLKLMSPRQLLERLSSRIALQADGPIDLPERHQTLVDALEWSYALLEARERALFEQVSIFSGGWTLAAAEAIAQEQQGGEPDGAALAALAREQEAGPRPARRARELSASSEIVRGLASLLDKSLVLQRSDPDGEARFYMLETIREYSWMRLVQSGGAEAIAGRHALYYLELVEQAELLLAGPQQQLWLGRLACEHDNLRASLEWAGAHAEPLLALRLAGALARFWFMRGYLREGMALLEQVLAQAGPEAPAGSEAELKARAKALNAAGVLAWAQGEPARARGFFTQSLPLFEALGDDQGVASTLNNLGNLARDEGNYAEAARFYERSLLLHRALGSPHHIAGTLHNLGAVAHSQHDYGQAKQLLEESLALRRDLGDRWGCAAAFDELGLVALHEGDFQRASVLCQQALELFRELGDRRYSAYALGKLARAALAQGLVMHARELWQESLALFGALEQKDGIAECLEGLARVATLGQNALLAVLLQGCAAGIRAAVGVPLPPVELPAYERELALLRELVPEPRFAIEWARGRGLAPEQAIALALAELP